MRSADTDLASEAARKDAEIEELRRRCEEMKEILLASSSAQLVEIQVVMLV